MGTRDPHNTPARLRVDLVRQDDPPPRLSDFPHLPLLPTAMFACTELRRDLTGTACLAQQATDPEDEDNKTRFCATGECLQGQRVRGILERLKNRRFCTKCQGVELGESNTDGLCSKCRSPAAAAAPAPLPKLASPYLAAAPPRPPAPPPPPAKPARIEEKPMPENPCRVCGKPLRSDNQTGVHTACKSASAAPRPTVQAELPGMAAAQLQLPPVGELPTPYLKQAVEELVRRRDELVQVARDLGLSSNG